MPRSSIIGTLWQDAWGTAGTQAMCPAPHIEGLGSYAEKIDDRLCFLAAQQADNVFCEDVNIQAGVTPVFVKMAQYRLYYNGYHPQFVLGFDHYWNGAAGDPAPGTYSMRLGGVDFGTIVVTTTNATTVEWYADIPDSFAAGEYTFQLYGASDHNYFFQIDFAGRWLALLPTRL